MKRSVFLAAITVFSVLLAACAVGHSSPSPTPEAPEQTPAAPAQSSAYEDAVEVFLDDGATTVNGVPWGSLSNSAVYLANDIVYYEAGHDFTYGEGSAKDAHSADEAAAHTVVHITQPGTYRLSGTLTKGQVAVDLGEDAEDDPEAIVTLILDGADIRCTVAPAVIFYNVYECGSKDTATATKDVDTSRAGANVIIADGSENTVSGAYVARIYKPGSVVLNDDGTEVEDAKKLHKYDAAFYSKMSMNVSGEPEGSGVLTINAENEGLDSELHLTVNGGTIRIRSGNDGINTNEDGVSVTTVNGGVLDITVTGETGEGDGIDSNGWLVINGGSVTARACAFSADAGIDSDMGIHINGGTVIATGHMLDRIEDGGQTYAVFSFAQKLRGSDTLSLLDDSGTSVAEITPGNDCSVLIYSSPALRAGTYTLRCGETILAGSPNGMMGGPGMMPPSGGMAPPDGITPPGFPEGMTPPEGFPPFDGAQPPEHPKAPQFGAHPDGPGMPDFGAEPAGGETSTEFVISDGGNTFGNIAAASVT